MWAIILVISIIVLVGAIVLTVVISKKKETQSVLKNNKNVEVKPKGTNVVIPNWMSSDSFKTNIIFTDDSVQIHTIDSIMETYYKVKFADIIKYEFKKAETGKVYFSIESSKPVLIKFKELDSWKTIGNTINYLFEYKGRINEGDAIIQSVEKLFNNKLQFFADSQEGKEAKAIKEDIENLPFVVAFKNHFGCTLTEFLKNMKATECENGYLVSGTKKHTGDGNKYIFLHHPGFKIFTVIMYTDNLEPEKDILVNIIQDERKYYETLSKADFKKFLKSWKGYEEILDIKYVKNIVNMTLSKQAPSGLSLAMQSELIHPMYAVGSVLESQEQLHSVHDLSLYRITFRTFPVKQIYIFAELFKMNKDLMSLAEMFNK